VLAVAIAAAFAVASQAQACVCADAPLSERLDAADAAVVGRVVAEEMSERNGAPQLLLTLEVDQRVKGDVERTLVVRSPSGSDCDLRVPRDEAVGLLLTRGPDGAWLGSACSFVAPGPLVAEGGEPRGGAIKVVIGLGILGLVLLWALRRSRRGTRPDLPGAPEP
jgi:MYXO-CTERM domain-containing protein